jgi:Flp pilus assembly protein TadG
MSLSRFHIRLGEGPDRIDISPKQAGQILVLFALMLTTLIGLVGIAIDVTYAWRAGLQVQRAADAAAMAGVVYLPGDLADAGTQARLTSADNGYSAATGAAIGVAPNRDNSRQLDVTITASVPTFFVRLFGINTWTVTRAARAGFQMPVPMGSPEAFYGVYCLTTATHPNCDSTTQIPGAASTTVTPHGAWGATQGTGSTHGIGDAFTPYNDNNHSLGTNVQGGTNPDYDPGGYNYAVELPAGGTVWIFDPTACAVGSQKGSGDHFNNGPANYSVSTYYNLYDMTATPLNYGLQPLVSGGSSGDMFAREYQNDSSGTFGTPTTVNGTSKDGVTLGECKAGVTTNTSQGRYWHDKWWQIGGTLGAGTYRLNITRAALGSVNQGEDFENDFAIEGVGGSLGGASPSVYGLGKIVTYNIIAAAGTQSFYLAQIGPENAGKTLEIDLFDIGDIAGTGSLQILSPNGNVYTPAPFTYNSDATCGVLQGLSAACANSTGTTSVTVTDSSGHQSWQDSWIHIFIKLPGGPTPPAYGCSTDPLLTCLKPPGETQQGWWKVQYTTTGGTANDTTTWMVSLLGNPVHLVPMGG